MQADPQNLHTAARIALGCLDLTSLNDLDTEADIARLCVRAQGRFGPVAALCVWPRLAAFARQQLPNTIRVAAVANFPNGGGDVAHAVRDTQLIVQSGAQEVDLVLPYRHLMAGDRALVAEVLAAVRKASEGLCLKVILETGLLQDPALMALACRLALDAGADFLKTSTGKTPVSATPDAARLMLHAIATDHRGKHSVGFKPSGGVRTVRDAMVYMALTADALGASALQPERFRIGASSLLDDIEMVLGNQAPCTPPAAGSY